MTTTQTPTPTTAPSPTPIIPPKKDYSRAQDGTRVVHADPYLEPYEGVLRSRFSRYQQWKKDITDKEGGLAKFATGYETFGLLKVKGGISYKEWAPTARQMFLTGDFNGWDKYKHKCEKDQYGVWTLFLPDLNGKSQIPHGSKVKVHIESEQGEWIHRIPAWMHRVIQEKNNPVFDGVFWNPEPYKWKNPRPPKPTDPRIYESHIGMSSELPEISTYNKFRTEVLPQVKELGYNTIQLMAIMEHAYYASFGYQVTSFFAISSRFGTPEELMHMIDEAHGLGIVVLLDVVHSHASKNTSDGLNKFDGSDHHYFHDGPRGYHPVWDSRLFNYANYEVMRFLLSNLRWWLDHYRFDGFRFDGVTAMIYLHRGLGPTNSYENYFGGEVDNDALLYLTLANEMVHELNPDNITIAEEVSGFAALCRPIEEGGAGFDYRLAMGLPDMWISMLKTKKDEEWDMGHIVFNLVNRRHNEKTIAYVESHDQALVGDKTVAFWLMDKEMYTGMSVLEQITPVVSRGMSLHKMIRLITFALGGEGWLTFMGNEFGHPEWIDFPRAGNNDSCHYARRRWDLARDPLLRYHHLRNFDKAVCELEQKYKWLLSGDYVQCKHEGDKVIAFERGGLLWIFNFHPEKSFPDYRIGVTTPGHYRYVLNTDEKAFGGFERISDKAAPLSQEVRAHDLPHSIQVYLPSRTAMVLTCKKV